MIRLSATTRRLAIGLPCIGAFGFLSGIPQDIPRDAGVLLERYWCLEREDRSPGPHITEHFDYHGADGSYSHFLCIGEWCCEMMLFIRGDEGDSYQGPTMIYGVPYG